MAKVTSLNNQEASKGKKIHTKAEYAIADALNLLRYNSGRSKDQNSVPYGKWEKHTGVAHTGSYFFTTDQMADHLMGETWFNREGRVTRFDTDNMDRDIDLILADRFCLDGKMTTLRESRFNNNRLTFSVKRSNIACTSGKVSIELKTFHHENKNICRDGWIKKGESNYTAFAIGHKAVVCSTKMLKELVEAESMCHPIYDHLSPELIQNNINQNRTYTDAQNMVVPIADLIEYCNGQVIDLPEWYTKAWDKATDAKYKAGNATLWGDK